MIKNNHIFVKHQMHIRHIKVIPEIIANFLIGADRIISDISNSATDKREGEVNFLFWKIIFRSEERRVGKEGRSRRRPVGRRKEERWAGCDASSDASENYLLQTMHSGEIADR